MNNNITEIVIFSTIIILIIYDIFILLKKGSKYTISSVLLELGKKYPIIPFFLGIVFGHIFWPN